MLPQLIIEIPWSLVFITSAGVLAICVGAAWASTRTLGEAMTGRGYGVE